MTTIVVRDGVMAADSRETIEEDAAGHWVRKCVKLFRKDNAIIGLQGESSPGLVFLDWYGSGKEPPESLILAEASFTALVLTRSGLFEYDKFCRPQKLTGKYHVAGSGSKVALGALAMGASAQAAVRIACKFDPYSALPVVFMRR